MTGRILRLTAVLLLAAVLLSGCAKQEEKPGAPDVGFLADESCFLDYTVKDGQVEIRCVLTLVNRGKEACSLRIYGDFSADKGKLLQQERLTAADSETGSEVFSLQAGEMREVGVRFTGTFAGSAVKNNRALPSLSWEDAEHPGGILPLQAYVRESKTNR